VVVGDPGAFVVFRSMVVVVPAACRNLAMDTVYQSHVEDAWPHVRGLTMTPENVRQLYAARARWLLATWNPTTD
jgi:hypothetical protein